MNNEDISNNVVKRFFEAKERIKTSDIKILYCRIIIVSSIPKSKNSNRNRQINPQIGVVRLEFKA